jgi:pilus assembly protein Flp/PilA
MSQLVSLLNKLRRDEDGATLVEYTMLLFIIVLAVITTLSKVGNWVNTTWSHFCATLGANCS